MANNNKMKLVVLSLTIIILIELFTICESSLKYTEQSCIDLTPRSFDDYYLAGSTSSSSSSSSSNTGIGSGSSELIYKTVGTKFRRKRTQVSGSYEDEVLPFKVLAHIKRYKRDSDVIVKIEGDGTYDGLIIQARAIPGATELYLGTSIGLIGQFHNIKYPLQYLTCFDIPYSTVIGCGTHDAKLGNMTVIWRSPDQDVGDIRFIASILRGTSYWIIVSNTLTFNPFPISSFSCGSTVSCFRVCEKSRLPCLPRESLYVITYHSDLTQSSEVEFTIGGRIPNNYSYVAVAFGDEYDSLAQSKMVLCHLENGRAELKHFLIESLYLPPMEYKEALYSLEVEDYDYDGKMLWCRFKRPFSSDTIINPRRNLYHFHFWGNTDYYHQHFYLPKREYIYSSKFKRNFTTPFNEIVASCMRCHVNAGLLALQIVLIGIQYY